MATSPVIVQLIYPGDSADWEYGKSNFRVTVDSVVNSVHDVTVSIDTFVDGLTYIIASPDLPSPILVDADGSYVNGIEMMEALKDAFDLLAPTTMTMVDNLDGTATFTNAGTSATNAIAIVFGAFLFIDGNPYITNDDIASTDDVDVAWVKVGSALCIAGGDATATTTEAATILENMLNASGILGSVSDCTRSSNVLDVVQVQDNQFALTHSTSMSMQGGQIVQIGSVEDAALLGSVSRAGLTVINVDSAPADVRFGRPATSGATTLAQFEALTQNAQQTKSAVHVYSASGAPQTLVAAVVEKT